MARLVHFSQVNAKRITLRSTFGVAMAFALCLWLLVLPTSEVNAQSNSACGQTLTDDGSTSGEWASGCESQARNGRHARFYTFALSQQSEVTITLESSEADTYVYLREGNIRSGPHLHANDDHDDSNSRSQIAGTLDAGTYTIEATTWGGGETGSFTLTISGLETDTAQPPGSTQPPLDRCWQAVTANAAIKGEWTSRSCYSDERAGSYSQFYTFTLGQRSEVTITLVSNEADPYLYLRAGEARSGAHLSQNRDHGSNYSRSQIEETLISGTYTIEATTDYRHETGSFVMTIAVVDTASETPKTKVHSSLTTLLAGEDAELVHESGARINIPRGATVENTVVSIDDISPPEGSDLGVGRVFEFSVGNTLLVRPATIYIPYELSAGQDEYDIDALRWNEEFQAWEVVRRQIDSDHHTAILVVEELGLFTTDARSPEAREGEDPVAIPEIVEVRVGIGYPFVERDSLAVGQKMGIQFSVRNAGQKPLSAYGENAAGQVFLTSPGPIQELPKLQSHVGSCLIYGDPDCSWFSSDRWKPGVIYHSNTRLGVDASEYFSEFFVPLEQPGLHTVRLELVFWDSGREIGRDVVEKEVYVTENPLIDPSEVEVDGRVYSVEGKENAQGKVEYTVTGAGGSAPDRTTRDKAVYTAALQQAFRSPINWGRRLLEFVGGAVERSLPFLEGVFFITENAISVLTVVFHPSPAAKVNAGAAIAGSVVENLIKDFANHPEEITKETALKMAKQAQEKRARWTSIREETRKGIPLSFDRAIEAEDHLRFHNAYWKPAGYAVGILTAPDFIVDPDVAETVARGSIGPIGYFAETDFLEGTLSLIEAVSVLGELGIALEEFEPWNEMKRDIKGNLSTERTEHAEVLRRLLITDHRPFELPALGEIVIPHYETLFIGLPTYVCQDTLIADAAFTLAGEWARGCASKERDGSYARFYTFTLSQQSEVTITLESSDADTYLYLREGHARSGAHLYENNDHNGSTSRSQIVEELAAATYTVEATTWGGRETGNFTLTIEGLGTTSDPSPGPKIDPVVESPSVSKSSLRTGESFTLSVSVRNQGDDAMASTSLRYYSSTNPTITSSDTVVGTDEVGSLTVGQNSLQSITLTAPTLVGTYYYGACVPPVPGESNTQNNCTDGVRTIVGDTFPDLVVQSPAQSSAVSKSSLNSGESFTLSFIVRNQGDGTSPSTTLRYYRSTNPTISSSDTEVGSDSVVGLGPNVPSPQSISLTAPSSAGTYYYGACVDSVPGESNTSNNCSSGVSVTVGAGTQGAPDLVVYSPSVYDKVFGPGERFNMAFWVRNQGDSPSTATASLKYYRSSDSTISSSDTELTIRSGTSEVGPISASGRSTVSVYLDAHSSGTYYYGACVGTVPDESNTQNNCAAVFRVSLAAPDLVVYSPSVNSSSAQPGGSFTLSTTVHNQGDSDAVSTTLRYYRSTDSTISTSDTEVGTDNVSSLDPNKSSRQSISLTAPSSAGTYYYGACVDAVSDESNTQNNCSGSVQVTVTGAAETFPDLVLESPSVTDSHVEPEDKIRVSVTVRNQGDGPSSPTITRFYLSTDATVSTSDTEVGTDPTRILDPNETEDESDRFDAPSTVGTYYYGACIDSASGESNTQNNCSTSVKVIVSKVGVDNPDLVVESPSVSSRNLDAGASFTLSATVRNEGTGRSPSTTLRYYRSTDSTISTGDTQVETDSVASLGPTETGAESEQLLGPGDAGTYYYGACVESVSRESNTQNNCSAGVAVVVTGSATVGSDLVVESPSVDDSSLGPDESFTLSVTVRNQGNVRSNSTTLRYYRSTDATITTSDTELDTDSVSRLDPSKSDDENELLTTPEADGTYYYGACVDSVTDESDTTNNCSSGVSVTVSEATQGAPDLVVYSPSVYDKVFDPGEDFSMAFRVRNEGDGASTATATLKYYRSSNSTISSSDTELTIQSGTIGVGPIAASGSTLVSTDLNAHSSGTYYYGACVGTVPNESDTTNNCAAVFKVTLTAPDLVIIRDSVSSSYVEAGDDFTFRATVRNDGTGDSPSTLLRYYRSSDATISTADTQVDTDTVSSLEPDETDAESERITVPSTTGTYYYGVCVDAVTRESDTSNNCSSGIQVTVTEAGVDAPDLTVDTPVISGFNGLPGDSVRFDIIVRNQGEERAGATTLRLYRSTDSTFTSSDRQLITWEVAPLNAGSSRTYYILNENVHNWVGTRYYGACVDSVTDESDTTNNCSSALAVTTQ